MACEILHVDDDPNVTASVRRLLRREADCRIRTAPGGEEALRLLEGWRPDLILLDVMMPGLGGHEVCRRIRKDPSQRFVKIILVSGRSATGDRLAGYAAGADDFLSKPFDVEELLAKVRVFARLKRTEELDEIKGDLLTLFAHETRTPLTVVLGATEVLLANPGLDAEGREMLASVRNAGLRLNQLAQKTLRLCELKGDFRLRPTREPVGEHLTGLARRFADAATERRVDIATAADPALQLVADWPLVEEILGHVLDNALRLTPAGGRVRIDAGEERDRIAIRVADQGPGVPAGLRARIFDEFSIRDLDHHQRGQGISLAIARNAMDRHGGTITVADAPGGGALFALAFPLESAPAAREATPIAPAPEPAAAG